MIIRSIWEYRKFIQFSCVFFPLFGFRFNSIVTHFELIRCFSLHKSSFPRNEFSANKRCLCTPEKSLCVSGRINRISPHWKWHCLRLECVYVCAVTVLNTKRNQLQWLNFLSLARRTLHPGVINLIYSVVFSSLPLSVSPYLRFFPSLSISLSRPQRSIDWTILLKLHVDRQQPHVSYCALKDDDSTFSSLLNLIMLDRAWQNNYTSFIVVPQHLLWWLGIRSLNRKYDRVEEMERSDELPLRLLQQTNTMQLNHPSSSILSKKQERKRKLQSKSERKWRKTKIDWREQIVMLWKFKYVCSLDLGCVFDYGFILNRRTLNAKEFSRFVPSKSNNNRIAMHSGGFDQVKIDESNGASWANTVYRKSVKNHCSCPLRTLGPFKSFN